MKIAQRFCNAVCVALALAALLVCLEPLTARAADAFLQWDAAGEPIEVDSESMELLGKDGKVIFTGEVMVVRGDLTLHSDRLEVTVDEEGKRLRLVEATGNVRMRKGEMVASGQKGTYDIDEGVVTLTGEPKVWQGRNVVGGETIELYLADERVVVDKPKALLYSEELENATDLLDRPTDKSLPAGGDKP